MTNRRLAEKIISTLGKHLAPGACSWSDDHADAHADLFGCESDKNPPPYMEDMVCDVEKLLSRWGSK